MDLAGMAPSPATSRSHFEHRTYPYLLRSVSVRWPNQVWSTDVTHLPTARGFMYPIAVIDCYSRRVLSWRISNSLDTTFCVDYVQNALEECGAPEVFNIDQDAQFISKVFTGVLEVAGATISTDGHGRALDNIFVERLWRTLKYEDVYLKGHATVAELTPGLAEYSAFYNGEQPHKALVYCTPADVDTAGEGVARTHIIDHFCGAGLRPSAAPSGQRRAAVVEMVDAA